MRATVLLPYGLYRAVRALVGCVWCCVLTDVQVRYEQDITHKRDGLTNQRYL